MHSGQALWRHRIYPVCTDELQLRWNLGLRLRRDKDNARVM
jgi:hypothetical protein